MEWLPYFCAYSLGLALTHGLNNWVNPIKGVGPSDEAWLKSWRAIGALIWPIILPYVIARLITWYLRETVEDGSISG